MTLLLVSFSGGSVMAADTCPTRQDAPLQNVAVFDGDPKEHVQLMSDTESEQSGYWSVDNLYDAGRFVTIRCIYMDGQTLDVAFPNRVNKCYYSGDSNKTLVVFCK